MLPRSEANTLHSDRIYGFIARILGTHWLFSFHQQIGASLKTGEKTMTLRTGSFPAQTFL